MYPPIHNHHVDNSLPKPAHYFIHQTIAFLSWSLSFFHLTDLGSFSIYLYSVVYGWPEITWILWNQGNWALSMQESEDDTPLNHSHLSSHSGRHGCWYYGVWNHCTVAASTLFLALIGMFHWLLGRDCTRVGCGKTIDVIRRKVEGAS